MKLSQYDDRVLISLKDVQRKPIIGNKTDDNHDISADSNSENNISDRSILKNKTTSNTIDKFKKFQVTLNEVYDWIHYSFYNIKSQIIINGFIKVGFVNADMELKKILILK